MLFLRKVCPTGYLGLVFVALNCTLLDDSCRLGSLFAFICPLGKQGILTE